MLKIKLSEFGRKNQRTFRLVVAEARSRRDGSAMDTIGWWNPQAKKMKVNMEKLQLWIERGAQLTPSVSKLIQETHK